MEQCACDYAAYVMELVAEAKKICKDPVVLIEQRLAFSRFVQEGFGTGDCVIIADGTLYIVDYKHGKGGAIDNCDGSAEKMAATMQDNLAGQLTILKSQLQELAISFGEILMPVIRSIVSKIQDFVDKLNGMDEGTKQAIVKIGLLVAAIGPFLQPDRK